MENYYLPVWKSIEDPKTQPTRVRNVIQLEYNEFKRKVLDQEPSFVKEITDSLYAGDAYLLKRAFPQQFMLDLRERVHEHWSKTPPSFHKIFEGVPDFHRIIDEEIAKNYAFKSIRHSIYFFPWNGDPLGVYEPIMERWRIFKFLGGLRLDEYEKNTPKDGVVDRIQVGRYPPKIGLIEPHGDPHQNQRVIISAYMSKRGVDYKTGGFYYLGKDDRRVFMEDNIDVGDIGISYATIVHASLPVDEHKEVDWNATDGRWWLGLYSIDSDEVKNRVTGYRVQVDEKS